MKIAILADQHGSLPPIPECDLLILSGDICGGPETVNHRWRPDLSNDRWRRWLLSDFAKWVKDVPCTVAVGGNHDTVMDFPGFRMDLPNLAYLKDTGCEYKGLKIWGAPWVVEFDGLAFNLPEEKLSEKWARIPNETDILVLHGPPHGIGDSVGDRLLGSRSLRRRIEERKPKLVTCGHIHEGRGIYMVGETMVVNSACAFTEVEMF